MPLPQWIYLASQSPRRRELLGQLGVRAELLLADTDEDVESLEAERPGERPADYVKRVTRAKADAAWKRLNRRALPPAPILVADTTVALGNTLLGKPTDAEDAHRILRLLSGTTHLVYTAVAMVDIHGKTLLALSRSTVTFDALSEEQITEYVASGDCMDKAGAYGIQGFAGSFVKRMQGSYSGIMGLPLHTVSTLLNKRIAP